MDWDKSVLTSGIFTELLPPRRGIKRRFKSKIIRLPVIAAADQGLAPFDRKSTVLSFGARPIANSRQSRRLTFSNDQRVG